MGVTVAKGALRKSVHSPLRALTLFPAHGAYPRKGTDPLFERKGCRKFKLRFDAIFPMKTRPHLYNIYFGSHFFGAAGGGAPRDLQQTAAQRRLMLTGVSSRRRQNPSKFDPFSMHTHAMESQADTTLAAKSFTCKDCHAPLVKL